MKPHLSRRMFLLRACAAVSLAGLGGFLALPAAGFSGNYKIVPLPGKIYSRSFLRKIAERRYRSAEEAILSVRDEEAEFAVEKI